MIGLTRKSKGEDEGTHADQGRLIEDYIVRASEMALVRVEKEHQVSGAKEWRTREIGQAILDCREHCPVHRFDPCPSDCATPRVSKKADGIIVAWTDRITRERLLAAAEIWEAMEQAGVVFVSTNGTDSRREDAEFSFGIEALLARRQWKSIKKRSNMGRARVVASGVHGGDDPPLGYRWTERQGSVKNTSGNVKHGPLAIDPETAPTIIQCFEGRAAGTSMRKLCHLTGLSDSGVRDLLRNPVYIGVAYSGDYVNNNGVGEALLAGVPCEPTHPPLISEELFARVQRTWRYKKPSTVVGRDNSLLSRVLVCASCGGVDEQSGRRRHLVLDRSTGIYRCKNERCQAQVTITAERIEGYVFGEAMFWHASLNPMYQVEQNEMLPEVMKELAQALDERDEIEQAEGLSAVRRAQALTEVDARVARLEALLAEAEAANGWLGMNTDAVQKRLLVDGPIPFVDGQPAPRCKDVRAGNEFIREMLYVVVNRVGRGRKVPVADRVEVMCLTPAAMTQRGAVEHGGSVAAPVVADGAS
jgi:DNA invertase Pin-like site-specific DNA recombinase